MAAKRRRTFRPAHSEEMRENQLVSLAIDLAEKQLAEGTASSQVITHYLKLGSTRERLEQERLFQENKLLDQKVQYMASAKRVEELYAQALDAMWLKANPNLGQTITYDTYHLDVERAEKAPASRNDILAKRFGIPMEGYTYFFTYEETLPHRPREFWGMPCALGADLSQGDDFCAFTLLFPFQNYSFGVKTRSYITSLTLMKLPGAMRVKYDEFISEGSLHVLDGTVLDMIQVYEDLDAFIQHNEYDVRCFGFDPYNAKEFVARWEAENGPFGIEKVIQGSKTESVPLGELKILAEERKLIFDEELMSFAMGNAVTLEDTNGNRKLLKKRADEKIDNVSAMMDAYVAYKAHKEAFE